ncbi:hypothetical protein EVS84_10590 [Pseudomonas koreensis]|uniref:Uncharacterized protein n=1 Tax=Pseudomonas koreensis TaxID=198620 RepID=A0A4Q4L6H2_9PSED|nr:hypothetical protein EVS84_10590 [Pseudomonas koreensis]
MTGFCFSGAVSLAGCGPFFIRFLPTTLSNVGASLLAKAAFSTTSASTDAPHSRAGSLPQDSRLICIMGINK